MTLVDRLLGRPDPERVVREHAPAVHRQLRRIFGPGADLDDVFQMVMVEVLRSLPSFAGRSKLSTWIRRITLNVAYQEMRTTYRRKHLVPLADAPEPHAEGPSAEDTVAQRAAMGRLYWALAQVHPKQRMPVIMHDIEGLTLREISLALGRPLQTIASQLHAGREQIAGLVQDERREPQGRAQTRALTGDGGES